MFFLIFRPFMFLAIRHPKKHYFDFLFPGVASIITVVALAVAQSQINVFGNEGVIDRILSFLQILPGFYIASLAAISTFNKAGIDDYMPDPSPNMKIKMGGELNVIKLTRRRFLCLLFAYITMLSILLCLTALFSVSFSSYFLGVLPVESKFYIYVTFLFLYFFFFWQLITVTFLGIYYLGDRLHQPES